MKQNVIAIFDIGKTNKKLLLFNENYQVVAEDNINLREIQDEDGFPCEDIDALIFWITDEVQKLCNSTEFNLKAVNFTTYGASVVCLNSSGKRITPLYNYLKPFPDDLLKEFSDKYCITQDVIEETCSPLMGNLNAGLQIYRLRKLKPELFNSIHAVLPFPQFLSFQFTGRYISEMTNVGCHSLMWDFKNLKYHPWLEEEGITTCLMPVTKGNEAVKVHFRDHAEFFVGVGLHDSSAAIVPYLLNFSDPFVIVSTGTWTISLNPFNNNLPQFHELENGSLSYLTYEGNPVKVSMLFAGHDHDQQVNRISAHFNKSADFFKSLTYDAQIMEEISKQEMADDATDYDKQPQSPTDPCVFHLRSMEKFESATHAYYQLVADIIKRQAKATASVINGSDVKNIYVDGGFCKNNIYMQQLTDAFPEMNVFSSSMTQGTALGAALAIHHHWNKNKLPDTIIMLKRWQKTINNNKESLIRG